MNRLLLILGLSLVLIASSQAVADTFGSGDNAFNIEFVTIGDPVNAADTTGDPNPAGAVAYEYRIGRYEISEQMINKANAQADLDGEPLEITIDARGPDKPTTSASWFEAAQFVNWLNTSTGATPAYKFDDQGNFQLWEVGDSGFDPDNLFRNSEARYFLPSTDEWYKAAFYDPVTDQYFDFPNGSDTAPIPVASGTDPNTAIYDQTVDQDTADIMLAGGLSPFGTAAQAGNVSEWEETEGDLINDDIQAVRGFRGGDRISNAISNSSSFRQTIRLPDAAGGSRDFRVAGTIPEPTTLVLSCSALLFMNRA